MKKGFVRGLWGVYDNSHRILKRRAYTDQWLRRISENKYNPEFQTYVFGEENQQCLKRYGIDSILIDKNPAFFDGVTACHRTKLEVMKYAMIEDGYDEVVFMDWDVIPYKKLPDDTWDHFAKKDIIQACLQQYKNPRSWHRENEPRKCPNGGFLYTRGEKPLLDIIKEWEKQPDMSMEPALSKAIDNLSGGWQGREYYWSHFEIDFCNLHRGSAHPKEIRQTKHEYMVHYQGQLAKGEKIRVEE